MLETGTIIAIIVLVVMFYGFVFAVFRSVDRHEDLKRAINEAQEETVAAMKDMAKQIQGEYTDLKLITCIKKRISCRETIDDKTKKVIMTLSDKYNEAELQQFMDSKEIQEPIEPCDCTEGCETCKTAEDEQDDTEAQEEVEDANKEAAGMIKNDSHRIANEKALAATKKACETSIGETQ
jgi:hypothetical protein